MKAVIRHTVRLYLYDVIRYFLKLLVVIATMNGGSVQAAPPGTISTVVGGGSPAAIPYNPTGIALDASGNLYVAEFTNHRILKSMSGVGIISVFAGNGTAAYAGDGGVATSASLKSATSVTFDVSGNLFIADRGNNRIRKVAAGTNIITTVAGSGVASYSGDGGAALSATLNAPDDIAVDAGGNLYFSDYNNNRVRKIAADTGIITTVAGNGTATYSGDGGSATQASLKTPTKIAVDSLGNIYIADYGNNRVRKVAFDTGIISTVAGNGTAVFSGDGGLATSAGIKAPDGIAVDSYGNLYISDSLSHRIRKVAFGTGIISTIAGNGTATYGGDGGLAISSALNTPNDLLISSTDDLYVSDRLNNRVRKIDNATGIITTVAGNFIGDSGPSTSASLNSPDDVVVNDAGDMFIVDRNNHRIRKATYGSGGIITTIAGNGLASFSGDGGPAIEAGLNTPSRIILDSQGNLVISDFGNHRIRRVDAVSGVISTIAGNGSAGFSGDGGAALQASLNSPTGIRFDSLGNLFVADTNNQRIRKIAFDTGIISTVAGSGTAGFAGDGGPAQLARLNTPIGVVVDTSGGLYIADSQNNRVRKVLSDTGYIYTVVGNGTAAFSGDGGAASVASLNSPTNVSLDELGNLYVADMLNHRVRKIAVGSTWVISTVAGNGTAAFSGDNGFAVSASLNRPDGVALDRMGNIYIADSMNNRIRKVLNPDGAPVINSFALAPNSTSLSIAITSFAASDNVGIAGYCITETNSSTGCVWSLTAQTSYIFATGGVKTLYAFVIDTDGNISNSASATSDVASKPIITAFSIPATSTSLTIPITSLTATDNVAVTGYLIKETSTVPLANDSNWSATKPTSYTFSTGGSKILFAFAKDALGNVSSGVSASSDVASKPVITSFSIPTSSTSLSVSITSFVATDNVGVAAYCVIEAIDSTNCIWRTKPSIYNFSSSGNKTLYAFVKDAAGNISDSASAIISIESFRPTISSFSITNYSSTYSAQITSFTFYDNVGVTNYCLTTADDSSGCSWSTIKPTSYTSSTTGIISVYAFVKDAAGNISNSVSATTVIDRTAPIIASFALPSRYNNLTVPVSSFTATDDLSGVGGYLITTNSTIPFASDPNWTSNVPTSYTFPQGTPNGNYTLYAWAKDRAGNVYNYYPYSSASVILDLAVPSIAAFSVAPSISSLAVPVKQFTASDSYGGVYGYLLTESSTPPLPSDSGWSFTAPLNYTFSSTGSKTLYAWVKDAAGNVSAPLSVSLEICSVQAQSDSNGAISLPGISYFYCSPNRLYKFTPNPGFMVSDIQVEGVSIGVADYYLFGNVTPGDYTISATFEADPLANWHQVAPGYLHALAVRADGTMWAWGNNVTNQLGDGTATSRNNPVRVTNYFNWLGAAAGPYHSLGLKADGTLYGWGGNFSGQLGGSGSTLPVLLKNNSYWQEPYAAGIVNTTPELSVSYSLVRKTDGSFLQMGASPAASSAASGLPDWIVLAAGVTHSAAIRADGTIWSWGSNDKGQLGDTTTSVRTVPVQTGSATTWVQLAAGAAHSVAIQADGSLWTWGDNSWGQLGSDQIASHSPTPIQIGIGHTWKSVAAGDYHTLALRSDGTVWACGNNSLGQLGDGSGASTNFLVQTGFDNDWKSVNARGNISFGIKNNNSLYAWGSNNAGQLGDDTYVDKLSPVLVGTNTNSFVVAATANKGGNISPSGAVNVSAGTSSSFNIAPLVGWRISDVVVDGVSQGAITSYTFSNVIERHTITASFAPNDIIPPVINTFSLAAGSNLDADVNLTASDNSGNIAFYCLNTSNNSATCKWSILAPTSYTFSSTGSKTLYAFVKDSIGNISVSKSATVLIPYYLTVSLAGNGAGSVHSSPVTGISCDKISSSGCTGRFGNGAVTLTASPDSKTSLFDGWAGSCIPSQNDCVATMNSDKSVTVTFSLAPKTKLDLAASTGYDTLQIAYGNAASSIFALEGMFDGDWLLNNGKDIVFTGGYLADYGPTKNGFTVLNGKLTVQSGSVRVNGLKIAQ